MQRYKKGAAFYSFKYATRDSEGEKIVITEHRLLPLCSAAAACSCGVKTLLCAYYQNSSVKNAENVDTTILIQRQLSVRKNISFTTFFSPLSCIISFSVCIKFPNRHQMLLLCHHGYKIFLMKFHLLGINISLIIE